MSSSTGIKRKSTGIEAEVSQLYKEMMTNQKAWESSRAKYMKAKAEMEKKRKFEKAARELLSESCIICSEDLVNCVESGDMSISSYKCRCTKKRVVHTTCWHRDFKCSCGETQKARYRSIEVRGDYPDDEGADGEYYPTSPPYSPTSPPAYPYYQQRSSHP